MQKPLLGIVLLLCLFSMFLQAQVIDSLILAITDGELEPSEYGAFYEEYKELRERREPLTIAIMEDYSHLFPEEICRKLANSPFKKTQALAFRDLLTARLTSEEIDLLNYFFRIGSAISDDYLWYEFYSRQKSGDDLNFSTYLQIRKSRITVALVTERDPGETNLWDHAGGFFDYHVGKMKLIAGSLKLRSGCGLFLSTGFPLFLHQGMERTMLSDRNRFNGILSRSENLYPEGVILTTEGDPLQLSFILLYNKTDGWGDSTGIHRDYTGFHTTPILRERHNNLLESGYCSLVRYRFSTFTLGLNLMDYQIQSRWRLKRQQKHQSGGVNFVYQGKTRTIAGELVCTLTRESAWTVNLQQNYQEGRIFIGYRCLSPDFYQPYSNFYTTAVGRNEAGWIIALQFNLSDRIKFNHIMDLSRELEDDGWEKMKSLTGITFSGKKRKINLVFREDKGYNVKSEYRSPYKSSFRVGIEEKLSRIIMLQVGVIRYNSQRLPAEGLSFALKYRRNSYLFLNYKCFFFTALDRPVYEYFPGVPRSFAVYSLRGSGVIQALALNYNQRAIQLSSALLIKRNLSSLPGKVSTTWQFQMAIDL